MTAGDLTTVSNFMQVILTVADRVKSLGLQGLAETSHYIRKFPWDESVTHPAAFYLPTPETIRDATNASDDYGYGVQIIFTQATNRDLDANLDRLLLWRQQAMGALHNKRLDEADIYRVVIEPGFVIDPAAFRAQYDSTTFTARCFRRIVR